MMNFNTQQAMINTKDTQKKMMMQIYTKYQVVIRSFTKDIGGDNNDNRALSFPCNHHLYHGIYNVSLVKLLAMMNTL